MKPSATTIAMGWIVLLVAASACSASSSPAGGGGGGSVTCEAGDGSFCAQANYSSYSCAGTSQIVTSCSTGNSLGTCVLPGSGTQVVTYDYYCAGAYLAETAATLEAACTGQKGTWQAGDRAACGDAGASDGGGDSAPSTTYAGSVLLVSNDTSGQQPSYDVAASFGVASSPTCASTPGTCCFTPPSSSSTSAPLGAGTINVTDGSNPIVSLGETDAGYGSPTPNAWAPGDALTFSATGDVVHSFSGTASAPPTMVITSPSPAPSITVPLSGGLPLAWSAGSSTTAVWAQIVVNTSGGTPDGVLNCVLSDSGSFTIPASTLASFHSGDVGALALARISQSAATCDNASVALQVASIVVQSLTFQ